MTQDKDSFKLFDASDSERLDRARVEIEEVIENGRLQNYAKGQLALALQVVKRCENRLKEREDMPVDSNKED